MHNINGLVFINDILYTLEKLICANSFTKINFRVKKVQLHYFNTFKHYCS